MSVATPFFFLSEITAVIKLFLKIHSEPVARANGCATVRTYTGHGVNNLFHATPNIPHYAKNKAVGTMKAGMVSFSFFFHLTSKLNSHFIPSASQ